MLKNSHTGSTTLRLWRQFRQLAGPAVPDLQGPVRDLGDIIARIPPISREIGLRYLHSSEVLEPLTNASEALSAHSAQLLKLAIGQDDGDLVVKSTTDLLESPFTYLESWRVGVQGYARELSSCEEVFSRLERSQVALNALVAPLKHLQTMFRIEAARLPEEVRQIFAGLTEQIAAVNNEVNETFAGQFQIVSQTLRTLEAVRQNISEHAERLQQGLTERRQRVADAMEKLRNELAKNGERETELSRTSCTIANSTTNVVVALQAHDICTQRLQHVCQAIAKARSVLETILSGGLHDKQALDEAWCLLMVQAAQIDGSFKHFEISEQSLQGAVGEISSKVLAFDDECILLKEFQEVTVATNGSVEVSLEIMEETGDLLKDVIGASRDLCESIQPVSQMTARLTDALESLSNKMRLIALNAQVQAVHIGSGTGLEVLAAQTASISIQTSLNAEQVSTDIQNLIQVVQKLTTSLQHITSKGEAALEIFATDSQAHAALLHGLRDKTLQELQLVGAAVDQIVDCTNRLQEDSQVRQAAVFPLDKLAEDLRQISTRIRIKLSRVDRQAGFSLQTNYKMQSERQVHSDVLADLGFSEQSAAPSDELPADNQAETLVEMF